MRMTHSVVQVAAALLDDPTGKHWGYALSQASGVRSGVLYPILQRMLDEGWLEDGWEDAKARKRPPRRYYELTPEGVGEITALVAAAARDARFRGLGARAALT
jgi:PadR family transcriptional regulator PadR